MAENKLISDLDEQILDRIRAVGLPNLVGPRTKVPLAKAFKVAQSTFYPDRVDVVLMWEEPTSIAQPIAGYLISVTGAVGDNQQPASPYSCDHSPAKISVPVTPGLTGVTFQLQTRLQNGFLSNIKISPTTGLQVVPGNQLNSTPSSVDTDVTLFTAATTLATYSIPSNTFVQGSIYRFTCLGSYTLPPTDNIVIGTYVNGALKTNARIVGTSGAKTPPFRYTFELAVFSPSVVLMANNLVAEDAQTNAGDSSTASSAVTLSAPITIEVKLDTITGISDLTRAFTYYEIFKDARF